MDLLVKSKLAERVNLEYNVQNIVATIDLKRALDIKKVIHSLANYIYEPDNFPGIIYKHNRLSSLIFATGKIIIAGSKSENQLKNTVNQIVKLHNFSHISYMLRRFNT